VSRSVRKIELFVRGGRTLAGASARTRGVDSVLACAAGGLNTNRAVRVTCSGRAAPSSSAVCATRLPQNGRQVLGTDLNRSEAVILCDYNGLDCLPGHNCTTGAQGFFPALSHRLFRARAARPLRLATAGDEQQREPGRI
jgi:hypothetical protein